MRKLIIAISIAFSSFSLRAQFKAGPEAGFNFSTWVGTIEKFNYRVGFYAGGKAVYYFNDEILIQSGVYFSQEGWKDKVEIDKEEVTQVLELDYLVIPLDFGIFAIGDRYRGLRFNFGLEYKKLLKSELISQFPSGNEPTELEVLLKGFDIGAKIGVDYKIDENIGMSFVIQLGVLRINETSTATFNSLNNQSFKFGLYYLF